MYFKIVCVPVRRCPYVSLKSEYKRNCYHTCTHVGTDAE